MVAYRDAGTKNFSGEFNSGEVNTALTYTNTTEPSHYLEGEYDYRGYNLVGNPYPSYIDWDATSGWTKTPLGANPSIYIWNEDASNYGAYPEIAGLGTNSVSRYIAPGQGFFVKAESSGNLTMTNDVRTDAGSGNFLKNETIYQNLKMKVLSNGYGSDEIVVVYNNKEGGAQKWNSMIKTAPSLYIPHNSKDYSVLMLSEDSKGHSIPFSFEAGIDGNYTISLESESAQYSFLQLEDIQTGSKIDLLEQNTYSFNSTTDDPSARFRINFAFLDINEAENDLSSFAYLANNNLIISSLDGEAEIQIFDMQGRIINTYNATGSFNQEMNLVNGVYVVRIISESGVRSQKIVF